MRDKFNHAERYPKNRVYIVRRKAGWFAVSTRKVDDHTEETTTIGPMNREDAVVVRNSFKHDAELEVQA